MKKNILILLLLSTSLLAQRHYQIELREPSGELAETPLYVGDFDEIPNTSSLLEFMEQVSNPSSTLTIKNKIFAVAYLRSDKIMETRFIREDMPYASFITFYTQQPQQNNIQIQLQFYDFHKNPVSVEFFWYQSNTKDATDPNAIHEERQLIAIKPTKRYLTFLYRIDENKIGTFQIDCQKSANYNVIIDSIFNEPCQKNCKPWKEPNCDLPNAPGLLYGKEQDTI
jgi:hypothetical protein